MRVSLLWQRMSEEDRERERKWAVEKHRALQRFLMMVNDALMFRTNPKARKAIYNKWVEDHGPNLAREPAKYVEAVIRGEVDLEPLTRMLQAYTKMLGTMD